MISGVRLTVNSVRSNAFLKSSLREFLFESILLNASLLKIF